MRYDIFLSSLLFGITLLTCSLAIVHLTAGFILKASTIPAHGRRKIRIFLLGASISFALLLFLVRLSLDLSGHHPFDFSASPLFSRITPRKILALDASLPSNRKTDPFLESAKTWTLYSKPTPEVRAGLKQSNAVMDSGSAVLVWGDPLKSADCQSWVERARTLKLEPKLGRPVVGALPKGALIILCEDADVPRPFWERLREHVFSGGSLLAVGRPPGKGSDEVQALFRVHAWRQPEHSDSLRVVLGGPRMAWGGWPSGLVVQIPQHGKPRTLADVSDGGGEALVLHEDDEADFGRSTSRTLTAMLLRDFGGGRVGWTSLPARLAGKLEVLHGATWDLLSQRVYAHLLRAPQAGLELWPGGQRVPVGVGAIADGKPGKALHLARYLASQKVPGSHFLLMNWVQSDPESAGILSSSKSPDIGEVETGAGDLDQQGDPEEMDFYTRYNRLARWREQYSELPRPNGLGAGPVSGALTIPGVTSFADHYAALIANRFSYVVKDPFGDQLSPTRFHLSRTQDMMLHFADGLSVADGPSQASLVFWPFRGASDLALLQRAWGERGEEDIVSGILAQYHFTGWAGGPYLLGLSLGGLGKPGNEKLLGRVLDSLKTEGAEFSDIRTLTRYWETRSDMEVSLEAVAPSRIPIDLRDPVHSKKGAPKDELESLYPEDESSSSLDDGADPDTSFSVASSKKDAIAYRVWVRNGGTQTFEKPLVRLMEGQRYRVYGNDIKVESVTIPLVPGIPEVERRTGVLRTIRVHVPDLGPGETYSFWIEEKEN
ncbi:MAG: hypothetical protein A2X94_00220 [Bdellovibrionales bacterium GWB1_55_8]|nr:MAG: hypothetical protein A2X94_00220 [Bdellovibrionales bacterium GWB1_55_8]